MKKLFCIMFALFLVIGSLSACGKTSFPESVSCEDILSAAQSIGEIPKAESMYLKSQDNLDSFSMSLWADGLFEECAELDKLSDYAIFSGGGINTYEIAVLKAETEENVKVLEDLIERRKKTLELGDRGFYDPDFDLRMENSVVYSDGLFVIFLITDDNDAAVKAIEALKE